MSQLSSRRRRARRHLTVGAALVVAALAASCGTDGDGGGPVTLPPTVPISTAPPATTPSASSSTNPTNATTTAPAPATTTPATTAPATTAPATTAPPARPEDARVVLAPVVELDQPIDITMRPGDPTTLYVAQRGGTVVRVVDGVVSPPLLDLSAETTTDAERGLLGIAFDADGSHLYVSFTDRNGDSRIEELAVGADGSLDLASRRLVLTQEQPYRNHNGGGIFTGPDGMLYIGFGDGGSAGDPERRALRADTWLGKLLRIDPRPADDGAPYRVPADNPFVGQPGVLPEIWSLGLRNPWRFSFDPATGDLWIGDVGQNQWEEIDWSPAAGGAGRGVSYGWSAYEATHRFNADQPAEGHVAPVFEYAHGDQGVSVTGGVVYRGTAIPELVGAYVYGDYGFPGLRAIALQDGAVRIEVTVADGPRGIVDIEAGPGGEVYVAALEAGRVYRLDPA